MKDSGVLFRMGKAAHVGTAVLKSRAWKMAKVKAFTFNFFQLVISLSPPPPPKLGKLPKLLVDGRLGGDKARLGPCGTFLYFPQ